MILKLDVGIHLKIKKTQWSFAFDGMSRSVKNEQTMT